MSTRTKTPERLKVRFPGDAEFRAALREDVAGLATPVLNVDRHIISVILPQQNLQKELFDRTVEQLPAKYGAEVSEDYRFDLDDAGVFDPETFLPGPTGSASLDELLEKIRAPEAWLETRGSGVTIAIVDSGINGNRHEFPPSRRSAINWAPVGQSAWKDGRGHGTMCATIAAASRDLRGDFDGVAPEATIMSCRTKFYDTELTAIYDLLRTRAVAGELIVANNSWGVVTGRPPIPPKVDIIDALTAAIKAGVVVLFSAGNNHSIAAGLPSTCTPNSIWTQKCREDVLTVANCKLDGTMWRSSSRGPGEFFGQSKMDRKPDVTAPTPQNGRILYGGKIVTLASGWGTSGASAAVAGLAALLRSKRPGASVMDIQKAIEGTAKSSGVSHECGGYGLIDCMDAVAAI